MSRFNSRFKLLRTTSKTIGLKITNKVKEMYKNFKFGDDHKNELSVILGQDGYKAKYFNGDYTIELHEIPAPIKTSHDMFVVTYDTEGVIKHYEVRTDLLLESVEMVKAMKTCLAENFPELLSTYTEGNACRLLARKSEFSNETLSRVKYTRTGGYSVNTRDYEESFDRAVSYGLIPSDALREDYVLLERFNSPIYFPNAAPGTPRKFDSEIIPFVRTFYNRFRLFKNGKPVQIVKPDERYQVCHGSDENPMFLFDVTTDRRGRISADLKRETPLMPKTLIQYILDTVTKAY